MGIRRSVRDRSTAPRSVVVLRISAAVIGLAVFALGLLFDRLFGLTPAFDATEWILVGIAAVYFALALTLHRLPSALRGLTVSLLALAIGVFVVELGCRLAKFDFGRSAAWNAMPIFQRMPEVPVGEVFFRRQGNAQWEGKVLWHISDANPNEAPVSISYDDQGFRNPTSLREWEIVFAGDSFTELGFLPDADLFTSHVARILGRSVKNLGVSHTGPLTHHFYLCEYGISGITRDAALVFFEGNDLIDLAREHGAVKRWKKKGVREYRDLSEGRHSSFIFAAYKALQFEPKFRFAPNAKFAAGDNEIPVFVAYAPHGESDLEESLKVVLGDALASWAQTAREHDVRPWLVYMPCKRRTLHEHLRFSEGADERVVEWTLSNLPRYVESLCVAEAIRFVDLTGPMTEAASRGELLYNPLDTHLNRQGSALAGRVIAEAMAVQSGQ